MRTFGELLIDNEQDRIVRTVLIGMLRVGDLGPVKLAANGKWYVASS